MLAKISICGTQGGQHYTSNPLRFRMKPAVICSGPPGRQSVTFTATAAAVAPGSGTPTGTVTFKNGTTVLGTGTLSGGKATFATSVLTPTPSPQLGCDSRRCGLPVDGCPSAASAAPVKPKHLSAGPWGHGAPLHL
jgi:hypothetical protein